MTHDPRMQSAILTPFKKDERASWGCQEPLIIWSAPEGAESLVGTKLIDATLDVDGAYVCLIPLYGLASALKVHVLPQLDTATLSSAGPDAISILDVQSATVTDGVVTLAGTGDGALADNTLQTASLTPNGARYALYTLTVASAGSVTFDVAEYTGL